MFVFKDDLERQQQWRNIIAIFPLIVVMFLEYLLEILTCNWTNKMKKHLNIDEWSQQNTKLFIYFFIIKNKHSNKTLLSSVVTNFMCMCVCFRVKQLHKRAIKQNKKVGSQLLAFVCFRFYNIKTWIREHKGEREMINANSFLIN